MGLWLTYKLGRKEIIFLIIWVILSKLFVFYILVFPAIKWE